MAKGKKSKGTTYVSKGERRSTARWIVKANRRDYLENQQLKRALNQRIAFAKGKNVMITIENPDKANTRERFIRVPASEVWKGGKYTMKSTKQS